MARRLGQRLLLPALTSLACFAVFSGSAAAQEGTSPGEEAQESPSKDDAARVLSLVKNANDEFDRGEYDDALRLYEQAYGLYPEAVLLYRIGLSAEKVGQNRRAVEAYQMYIDAAPEGDATAQKLAERVAEIKATMPSRVQVTSTPPGASVFLGSVDNEPLGVTPVTLEVGPGEQTFVVRLDGYRVSKETVSLAGGEDSAVAMQLAPLERLASTDPEIYTVEEETPDSSVDLGLWGYVAGATGVALIGTGAVFEILSQSKASDVNEYDKRAPGASREEIEQMKDQARSYYNTAVATFIVGGVFTAAGVVLILLDATMSDDAATDTATTGLRFDFAPTDGGGWIGVSGQF